ncbi:phytochelatin synthase family protein [Paraburkholderia bryophila]|uniref:phytochelatin synthase family protein n=1 Tax=Paraburkholderia bryophila TaxID=420952 RepID=UPI00234ABD43|nr:phytochelatin synthase family protein [Paraburkholderia bryophila]WCM24990.1 phytochelatin synthase family protein [Paraburkholderia bryophila]
MQKPVAPSSLQTSTQGDGMVMLKLLIPLNGFRWRRILPHLAVEHGEHVEHIVARCEYPAVWVPVAQLYAAALAVDNLSGLSRGGLGLVGRRQG